MVSLPPLVVVAGPTAAGKTELGIRLGEWLMAEGRAATVISADSRQIYRGLDIGTAKVSDADRRRVPHAGLDLVDPDERFAVSGFTSHVNGVLEELAARGGVALLVGGTGLYLRAVARGLDLASLPDEPAVRARLEAEFDAEGLEPLAARLQATAPTLAAGTHLANPRRVIRALEIAELRGDGPRPEPRGYGAPSIWLGLDVAADEHRRRIATRARAQFDAGLIDEAVALRERYDPRLPAFSAIGYHEAWGVADGIVTREQAIDDDARRNIAFAKRQRTWFRAERDVTWLDARAPFEPALELVRRLIG
ncbi:MAG: tRNA (adenosine(37)-N6)-dimethylallyltransferase MiaA [Chloroflexota bacterium]